MPYTSTCSLTKPTNMSLYSLYMLLYNPSTLATWKYKILVELPWSISTRLMRKLCINVDITIGSSCSLFISLKSSSTKYISSQCSFYFLFFVFITTYKCLFLMLFDITPFVKPPVIILTIPKIHYSPYFVLPLVSPHHGERECWHSLAFSFFVS